MSLVPQDLAAKMDEAFPDEGAPYPPAAVDGFEAGQGQPKIREYGNILYRSYIWIMEKKMETTVV